MPSTISTSVPQTPTATASTSTDPSRRSGSGISSSRALPVEVATQPLTAADTTGAGDAFDAGFLVGWFGAIAAGRALPATLRQAAVAGHRAAARQLSSPRTELGLA